MQREKPPEWREKQKGSRGIRRGQRYRLVFQFPIREPSPQGASLPRPETTVRGQTAKVFACFWAKTFVGCAFHPWTGGDGCGCLCPRRQGLKRVYGTGHNNGQGPAATTKSACAKRRCPSHPGGLLPGCRERRSRRDRGGATGTVAASRGFSRIGP